METDGDKSKNSNIIRVKLLKQKKYGLGFLVRKRSKTPHVVVSELVSNGTAAESGLVQIGDVILKVNDVSLNDLSYERSVEMLKALPIGVAVCLILKGPEGYSSHLETRFNQDGTPKTVRITKPILHSEGFIGRIRKSLSASATGRSCRTKQTQANCECHKTVTWHGDDTRISQQNGEAHKENQCLDKSHLSDGSNEHTTERTTTNEPSNSKTNLILTTNYSESNEAANSKGTVSHNNESGTNNNSPKLLSQDLLKEKIHQDDNIGKTVAVNVSGCRVNTMDILNKEERKQYGDDRDAKYRNNVTNNNICDTSKGSPLNDPNKSERKVLKEIENGTENGHGVSVSKLANGTSSENGSETFQKPQDEPANTSKALLDGKVEKLGTASSKTSPAKKFVKLRHVGEERPVCTDTLHQKAIEPQPCTAKFCMGSVMDVGLVGSEPRPKQEVLIHAKDFINQYYQSIKRHNSPAHLNRWSEVEKSIIDKGTYELTTPELTFGAKTAWRNAPRCIGRIQWSKLQVFDARHITTARGMFEAICNHIKYGTNKGNIRSAITVFPPRTDGKHDFRVWNPQFIRYAGYKQEDGSVVGDPANVELTEICQKLGWKGKGTRFDVLPLILQANGHDPEMFEIPSDLVLEVNIKHPKFPWFAEMGLKWYALPAVSSMVFDCGGLLFVAAPFNGWFMGTEIGARDLCDPFRYNLLEDIAKRMGFDTRKSSSLWKDRTLVEINVAVLYSYQSQGVTITDHHAASESFMKHLDNEQKLRGGCPADWVWVVPPMSGSILPVFHQEMLSYKLKPSLEYQADAWKTHVWKKDKERTRSTSDRPRRKIGFRELARAVKFSAKLMGKALARRVKCVILYATETGKSEGFAKTLCQLFRHAFDAKVMCMNDYDVSELEHEALVLIVTSTFGNGDPPENGESFAKHLYEAKHPDVKDKLNKQTSYLRMSGVSHDEDDVMSDDKASNISESSVSVEDNLTMETGPLSNVRYSVFGLGSSAYPNFCAFAHYVDNMFNDLGAEKIYKTSEGDELCGQEESFKNWAKDIFKAACETFCTGDDRAMQDATGTLTTTDHSWKPETFRVTPASVEKKVDIIAALSTVHNKSVIPCRFMERTQLQSAESDRQTMLIKIDTTYGSSEMLYQPGDHVAIYAQNSEKLVDAILIRLHNAPPPDQFIKIEVLNERSTPLGTMKSWDPYTKFPACTLRTAFSRFLDITTPPTQTLLKIFATQAGKDCDRESLENLANDSRMYEEWKYESYPNIVQVLDQFPSLRIPPSLLLTQLPLLTARFYSISSSLQLYPGEIHATIAVVKYRTQGNNGPLHEGVCSNWLNRLEDGETIPCIVRHAPAFHMPEDPTVPIILVGPGTGIAPFRSFWQQRKIDMEMLREPQRGTRKGWGKIYQYFGCRNSKLDDIYKEELKQMKNEGVLTEVHTALSREPDTPKTYVQTILKQNAAVVFNCIVKEGGHFYVCGDVKMASDVTATLEKILSTQGDMTMQDAKNFIMKLRDSNRFHEDIFGVTLRSSEVTDRARDQAKKAWNYINSASKTKSQIDKETVAPIPPGETKAPKGKPKAPRKAMYTQDSVA
ncbi:nitric oxide synthase, brain-like [Mercenaria mercenaria]|uniref:nitric oxide synthase, brain-like n=1 Tax=Mercenaria mercenaria TaxID=6596 RepID=UPI00234F346A|nr:nitric oxide synthase, brain-like [Mercenaria mercenaria]